MSSAWEVTLEQGPMKDLSFGFETLQSGQEKNLGDSAHWRHLNQVHGKDIVIAGSSRSFYTESLPEGDGWLVEGPFGNIPCVVIQTADCVPLVMVDRLGKCAALIHAGWRGLQKKIHLEVFERGWMDPREALVWIGPSLNGMNFEVKADMMSQFEKKWQRNSEVFLSQNGCTYFFPWNLLRLEYAALGVPLVYNLEIDTFENTEFASYRRMQKSHDSRKLRNYSWLGCKTKRPKKS